MAWLPIWSIFNSENVATPSVSGFGVWDLGFGGWVSGVGCRVEGAGCRVQGVGCRV